MNPRATGVLFLIAVALGAFVYFYEIRGREARDEAEAAAKRLFSVDGDVEWIELTASGGERARLERRDGEWRMIEPVDFPGDAVALDAIAESLAEIASEGVIEIPQDAEIYGLGEEALVVRFGSGDREHELRLGKKTPVGANTYATTDASDAVYTVESFRARSFERELDDLRERRPLRFDRERVDRIDVEWKDQRLVAELEDGTWQLREPIQERADEVTIDTLLSDLGFLRAEGFVDESSAGHAGFDPPAYRVVLHSGEGPEGEPASQHELVIGGELEGATRAARAAEASLYKIASERYGDFPRELNAFRYKQLNDYTQRDATGFILVLREPGAESALTVRGRQEEGSWVSEPEPMSAGREARLVGALAGLRAKDIIAEEMGAEERRALGLEPPNAAVTIIGESESEGGKPRELTRLHLGTIAAGVLYAVVPGSDRVYALDATLAEEVPVSLEAFRNRFVSKEDEETAARGSNTPINEPSEPAEEGDELEP